MQSRRYLDQEKEKDKKKSTKGKVAKENVTRKTEDMTYDNIHFPSNRVQCDECQKDISKYTKINVDSADYCVTCFAKLRQFPETYQIISKLNFPLFEPEWSAEEELLLFEGLERHGFGNWNQIADHIATDKSKEEVERHYEEVFLSNQTFMPSGQNLLSKRDKQTLRLTTSKTLRNESRRGGRKPREQEVPPVGGSLRSSAPLISSSHSLVNTGQTAEIVGYIPKRGQFEVQYDNDAELLLAEMEFNDDDTEEERNMKYKLLDIYNYKLNERIKRKDFVIKRQLLDIKHQSQLEKNRSKDEREIHNMMKVFARFNTPEDHQKLVEGIVKEKQIRQRIEELRQYKKLGLKTLAQVEEYLEQKRKKDEIKIKKMKTTQSSYLYDNKIKTNLNRRTRTSSGFQGSKPEKRNQFISAEEEKVCEKLNLPIPHYIAIKETLVRECVKEGTIKKDAVEDLIKVEKEKSLGVFDFLVTNNIILSRN